MNEIILPSGDSDPNSDYFQLSIVMEAGATSSLYVYESGGSGFLAYNTRSDFIREFSRVKSISQETGQLSAPESLKIGYPNSFTWIPGDYIAYNAESYSTSTGYSLSPSTQKTGLSDSDFFKSRTINLNEIYDDGWTPSGYLYILCANNDNGLTNPFVSLRNAHLGSGTGIVEIASSSVGGSFFDLHISSQPQSGMMVNPTGSTEQFGVVTSPEESPESFLSEWNSIFEINDNCNAYSTFSNGNSRDEVFLQELDYYVSENWNGKLKTYLWGDMINNPDNGLSSSDPSILRNVILYSFNFYGASNDIFAMGLHKFPDAAYPSNEGLLRFHIGLSGYDIYTNSRREFSIGQEYLPMLDQYKEIPKIIGLPPRTSYANSISSNQAMTGFIGTVHS
tara:strand:- start:215 stop:1393 length:1179 start_codon:yes stop_codon:yes gene_type:complete